MKKIQILLDGKTFHPQHTFENGQCFRWRKMDESYVGVIKNAIVKVAPLGEDYCAEVVKGQLDVESLEHYFDIGTPYETMVNALGKKDKWLNAALQIVKGLRLLRQDPFEMLITFIISSNNNIPKITMSVEDLCLRYGEEIGTYQGIRFYAFPTLEALSSLTEEDLKVRAIGYRAKALHLTIQKIVDESLDLAAPYGMTLEEGIQWLTQFYGVGEKVAQCVLLFGYQNGDAYPIDTWVKQLLKTLYGVENHQKQFIESYFDEYRGFAQQVLFYYMRQFYNKGIQS